jgi:hypothetical protein
MLAEPRRSHAVVGGRGQQPHRVCDYIGRAARGILHVMSHAARLDLWIGKHVPEQVDRPWPRPSAARPAPAQAPPSPRPGSQPARHWPQTADRRAARRGRNSRKTGERSGHCRPTAQYSHPASRTPATTGSAQDLFDTVGEGHSLLADRAYESDALRVEMVAQGAWAGQRRGGRAPELDLWSALPPSR